MKKLAVILTFLLMGWSSQAQTKTGTIDADYILSQMPEMEQVKEGLKAYDLELQQELKDSITKYETLVKDYQANNETYTEVVKKEKEAEIIGLEEDIKGFRQKAALMMQMKRNELTKPLYEKINSAMLKVVEREKYTQIFHASGTSLAFSAEEYDITDEVIAELGITSAKE